jgi:hypothetical protein
MHLGNDKLVKDVQRVLLEEESSYTGEEDLIMVRYNNGLIGQGNNLKELLMLEILIILEMLLHFVILKAKSSEIICLEEAIEALVSKRSNSERISSMKEFELGVSSIIYGIMLLVTEGGERVQPYRHSFTEVEGVSLNWAGGINYGKSNNSPGSS